MERHYNAFISYRHAPLDSKVAADIQNSLERFPIPKALQKSRSKKRIGPIFRDKEELPTSSNLSEDIEKALKNSDYLIVICSTRTCESIWVQREIETFLKDHDRQHILTVLVDGEPQDVIPEILYHELVEIQAEDGTFHTITRNLEPLSCDYRRKRNKAKREELPRLAAAILNCPYDELRRRQRRRQIRQMATAFSAALLLVSAVAAFAVNRAIVIAQQADQIEEEYRNSLINQSRYLAEKSGELLAQGDRLSAIQVALSALPASEEDDSRPLVTEALYALNNAVYPYHVAQIDDFLPKCVLKTDGKAVYDYYADSAQFSPNETRWLTIDDTGQVSVFDLEQDSRIAVLAPRDIAPVEVGVTFLAVSFVTEDRIALYLEYGAVCWDLETNSAIWTTMYTPTLTLEYGAHNVYSVLDVEHHVLVVMLGASNKFYLLRINATTGEIQDFISFAESKEIRGLLQIALSPDGTELAVGIIGSLVDDDSDSPHLAHLLLADLDSGTYQLVSTAYADVPALTFLPSGQVVLVTTDIYSSYGSRNSLPCSIELYNFEDGSLVWSSPGNITSTREVENHKYPTASVQFWHQVLFDGSIEDYLVAQLAGHVFILDPETGQILWSDSFSEDILDVVICDNIRLFLPCRNGRIMMYCPHFQVYNEVGSISQTVCSASFSSVHGEFLLKSDSSQDIVVMSNRLGNTDYTTVDVEFSRLAYYQHQGREYRILYEAVESEEGSSSKTRLLFYTPLSDSPFAVIDGKDIERDICIKPKGEGEKGEDICYYFDYVNSHHILCGWGLESNQKVFEYNSHFSPDKMILGFPGEQILCLNSDYNTSELRLIDSMNSTERRVILDGDGCEGALSGDGKYAAVTVRDLENDTIQLCLIDVENWKRIEVPAELRAHPYYNSGFDGNLTFSQDSSKLAVWTGDEIVILDLNTFTVSQHVQIPCTHCGYSIFLNDHILLVYGDSGRLTSWDLNTQSTVMKDPYNDITDGSHMSLVDNYFHAGDNYSYLYTYNEDGKFARYLSIDFGISLSGSEVLVFYNEYGVNTLGFTYISDVKIFPLYSFDELLAMANEILDGRTLTESERIQYFIDS